MTGEDYVFNVMMTVQTNYASLELGEPDVLMFVNKGRTRVFNALAQMRPQLFQLKKTGTATLTFATTDGFYEDRGCFKDPGSGGALVDAAKCAWQELNKKQENSYGHATTRNPIYTIEHLKVNMYQDATLTPAGSIVEYFLQAPVDLAFGDTENVIPAEAQDLVVRAALVEAYQKKSDPGGVLDVLEAEYKTALAQYSENAQDIEENMRLLLTSNQSPQNMR